MDDPNRITYEHVELVVEGLASVPYPSGRYPIAPQDEPLFLYEVLERALERIGRPELTGEVYRAARDVCARTFQPGVERMERDRIEILKKYEPEELEGYGEE